jgi:predicted nucleic acid-binding protein
VSLRGIFLWSATANLYLPYWTQEILNELQRNLIKDSGLDMGRVNSIVSRMNLIFPQSLLSDSYQQLIPNMTNEPKDRHVLAAAVHNKLDYIVTPNLKDFPPSSLVAGVQVISPDDFLLLLLKSETAIVLNAFSKHVASLTNPPITSQELLDRLAKNVPQFAAQVRQELGL